MSIESDYSVLRDVLNLNPRDWAIEFGVYTGYSLSVIAHEMPVIGLDSFEGLPEDWRPGFPKGKFDWQDKPLPHTAGAMLLPGPFNLTLRNLNEKGLMPRLGLVHIDCDLYSSTVTALEGVLGHIGPGTYVVFDEYHGYEGWEQHEAKAWTEFCARNKVLASTVFEGDQERAFVVQSIGAKR